MIWKKWKSSNDEHLFHSLISWEKFVSSTNNSFHINSKMNLIWAFTVGNGRHRGKSVSSLMWGLKKCVEKAFSEIVSVRAVSLEELRNKKDEEILCALEGTCTEIDEQSQGQYA